MSKSGTLSSTEKNINFLTSTVTLKGGHRPTNKGEKMSIVKAFSVIFESNRKQKTK